jgi:hypothetical protein
MNGQVWHVVICHNVVSLFVEASFVHYAFLEDTVDFLGNWTVQDNKLIVYSKESTLSCRARISLGLHYREPYRTL